jgi:hypothetical protein
MLEAIAADDRLRTEFKKVIGLQEKGQKIHGFVTVTINKGKQNERVLQEDVHNLLTNAGRDFFHAQCYTNTVAGTQGTNYIAVSDDATDPDATDTVLAGEITTGGLERAVADTITHVADTNTTTLEITYTATSAFTDIHKSALFNAAAAGTMSHEAAFDTDVTLAVDDTLTVTWTLTLG